MLGRTIGRYEIVEKVGGGGMGVVYKARDRSLDRFVALKFISPEVSTDPDMRERFTREARAASALDHPQICAIHEISATDEGELFIVMAYVAGQDLKSAIARGPMGIERAINIALQIARGLARAHELGISHRDVKPANIILNDRDKVKIVDFGLARLAGSASITRSDGMVGTVAYMAPEQIGGGKAEARTDVWALTLVLYEMLAGRNPFLMVDTVSSMNAVLTITPGPLQNPAVDAIIRSGLAKNPNKRYASMPALIADLESINRDAASLQSNDRTARMAAPSISPSIAVLPFSDYSPQRDQEYFCEGIAEEILNVLTKIQELRVASRTSSRFSATAPRRAPSGCDDLCRRRAPPPR